MDKKLLLVKIAGQRIFFNPELSIAFEQTAFPTDGLMFKPHVEFFWLVEMVEYEGATGKLTVKVLDYQPSDTKAFATQTPKRQVNALFFSEKLDWTHLEPQLSHYAKARLSHLVKNIDAEKKSPPPPPPLETHKSIIHHTFSVSFNEVHISLGYASITHSVPKLDQEINFKIPNDHLLPEFDHIRFWFAKKLGDRKVNIHAQIHFAGGKIEKIVAHSKEIAAISSEMIDSVKQERTLGLMKIPVIKQPDKSLFTAEDIFDQATDDSNIQGNVFKQSEKDILEMMLAESTIRNKHQLMYLSGHKQSEKHKVRFTLAPQFGFLFLVEGERYNHFVWELLNSHATYIWSIGKTEQEIRLQYNRIEQTINMIRNSSREAYNSAYRSNSLDEDLLFTRLQHTHASSPLVDGFPKWKHRLNELLV